MLTTILVIVALAAGIFFTREEYRYREKKLKRQLKGLDEKNAELLGLLKFLDAEYEKELERSKLLIFQNIFPRGQKDVDERTKDLIHILNGNITQADAELIIVKASSFCVGRRNGNRKFTKDDLKKILMPDDIKYFNEDALNEFYDYLISTYYKNNNYSVFISTLRELSQTLNPEGTEKDQMEEGYGEFGLELTNPVPVASIPDSYVYLNNLRTEDGDKIKYRREGQVFAHNIKYGVSSYKIFRGEKEITRIYICPYNKKNSKKAPKGFKLA